MSQPRHLLLGCTLVMCALIYGAGLPPSVHAQSLAIVKIIAVPGRPHGVAIDSANKRVFASSYDTNELTVIETGNHTIETILPSHVNPHSVAVDPSGKRVYVSGRQFVSVYNSATLARLNGKEVGGFSVGIDADPLRSRAVTVYGASVLGIITTTLTGINGLLEVRTGSANQYVAVNPVTNRAYVTRSCVGGGLLECTVGQASVMVYDLTSNDLVADILFAGNAGDITVDNTRNRIYTSSPVSNTLLIINGATNTVIDELSVPGEPVDTAVNSEAGCLYTANAAGNSVTVIDTKTTTVLGTIAVGSDPKAIAVDQNTGLIYVANRTGSSITVLRDNACFDPPPATAIPTRTNTPQARRVRLPLVEGPIEREQTPNDSVGSAQTIRSSRGISGRLEDAYDVYTFEAASDGPVSVRLLNIPESLSERVQLSVHLGSDLTNLANRRVFDTLAPWEGSFSATAGRYYVLVFTDPAFRSAATPYLIEASYP